MFPARTSTTLSSTRPPTCASVKIPGFRKGKVPMPVLRRASARSVSISEAIESHISGWYWKRVAARARIRPAEQPELDYELPDSDDPDWRFTATCRVLPKPEVADWTKLQVPVRRARGARRTSSTTS